MQYHEIGKTGMKVSSLSFGASSLGGVFHDIKEKEGITAVFTAIESGIYNPQIEMFARFKMKSSFHKTKRII